MNKYKLGIIGAGNMSTAIWKGILSAGIIAANELIVSDISEEKLESVRENGAFVTNDNLYLAENSEYLLFAVKPQCFPDIAKTLKGKVSSKKIISIMAGVKLEMITSMLDAISICRVMPNTPCMVMSGMSALCFNNYSDKDKEFAFSIFNSIGETIELSESKFDAVTSVSGSGPAYVYMFINAMIKGGIAGGLSFEESKKLTIATMRGGCRMVENSDHDIDSLVDAVCSKGGTTIQAVNYYKNSNLENIIIDGIERCRLRSVEMGLPKDVKVVTIFTDGACSCNPGPGGWCAIMNFDGSEKILSGGEDSTTNNRMELKAVIEGLSALKKHSVVEIYSDSAYVVNAVNQNWILGWKLKNWVGIKNPDLWIKLSLLLELHDVSFIKVKGHSNVELNNRCDDIAKSEIKKLEDKATLL